MGLLTKLFDRFSSGSSDKATTLPSLRVYSADEHSITRRHIDENALSVVEGLQDAGYEAYLVGGCVRDLLLGREPKDFDIVTDAHPEDIKAVFARCRIIGRRFRLAHVYFGREYFEVATFRATHKGDEAGGEMRDGMITRDNVFGTPEEDAERRDFTVNALYYEPESGEVLDYFGGFDDVHDGLLRMIGDPATRYREDPVRMLRAARFAAKLGFRIHPDSEQPLYDLGHLLGDIPPARLFEEVLKLFLGGCAVQTFETLRHYRLFEYLFPLTDESLAIELGGFPEQLVLLALTNTDKRLAEGKPVTPAFLIATMLWHPMCIAREGYENTDMPDMQVLQAAASEVLSEQIRHVSIPKRFSSQVREIWAFQPRLLRNNGKRTFALLEHQRFRAAYDFMLLRCEAGETELQEVCDWWTRFQEVDNDERIAMSRRGGGGKSRPRRRRSYKKRKPKSSSTD